MSADTTTKKKSILKLTKEAKLSTEDIIDYLKKEYPDMDNLSVNTKLDEDVIQKLHKRFKKEFDEKEKADSKVEILVDTTNVKIKDVEKKREEEEREKQRLEEARKLEEANRQQQETIRKGMEDRRMEEEAKRLAEEEKAMNERKASKKSENKRKTESRSSKQDGKQTRSTDGKERPASTYSKDKTGQPTRGERPSQPRRDGDTRPPQPRRDGDTRPPQPRRDGDTRPSQPRRDGDTRPTHPRREGDTRSSQPRRDGDTRPPHVRKDGDTRPTHPRREGDTTKPRPKTDRPGVPDKKSKFVKFKVGDNLGNRKPGNFQSNYKKTDRPLSKDSATPQKPGKVFGKDAPKKEDSAKEKARRPKVTKTGKLREFTQKEIDDAIRETFSKIEESQKSASSRATIRKKKKKERLEKDIIDQEKVEQTKNVLKVTEFISTSDLANLMNVEVTELIKKCFSLGMMVSINQRLEKDLIILLADEMGYQIEFQTDYEEDVIEDEEDPALMVERPPVVTIMGHVDHGKTSLLDKLRKTNVVAGEAGGITQHIGAYTIILGNGKKVTFLDTPGHEAFTSMRARGGQAADMVVLVVAADDSVMPQTVEAINHALAANVPIIVAINKIDKPDSNPERIKQQLSERNILVESWGGKFQSVEISAKEGLNLEELLEKILLEAEILQLKANPDGNARGIVLEAKLDKGKGTVASLLVTKGTLEVGDVFICGVYSGKIKAMFDERDNKIDSAGPSQAVQVLGFDGMPQAGDTFVEMESEREAKEIATKRQQLKREQDFRQIKFITLDDISKQIQLGEQVELNIILKADTDGSAEALADSLLKLATPEAKVRVIHKAVGQISESDVILAEASNAVIIGFNVRPNLNARKLAESKNIDIRLHNIIYNLIEEIKHALEGLLAPEIQEKVTCTVEVRDIFKVPKIGNIAGCYVQEGKITRNTKVRLLRDGFVIFDGTISSLKRIKDDVREVDQGYECGIGLENFNDVKVGDIIEGYEKFEIKRKLTSN